MSKLQKCKSPAPAKVRSHHRVPLDEMPPGRTQHTQVNVNVDAHLVIREMRKLIIALVFLILLLGAAIFGS